MQLCDVLENDKLKADMNLYADMAGVSDKSERTEDDGLTNLVLKVAKALSYSPSRMTPALVKQVREMPNLEPSMLVELVSFLATVQMLHRFVAFYEVKSIAGL